MEKIQQAISKADVCELAHAYTQLDCDRLGIEIDMGVDEAGDETERYSARAQTIFDKHYDLITTILGV